MNLQLRGDPAMKEEVAAALIKLGVDPTVDVIDDLHMRLALKPLPDEMRPEAVLAAVTTVRQDMEKAARRPDIVTIPEMNGIRQNQRVSIMDVEASPPKEHFGKVAAVWSDGSAYIDWDDNVIDTERDKHLVSNGRVDLHHIRPVPVPSGSEYSLSLD
jgi:hypothetical protein